jgi:hypothetical protein
VALLAGLHVLFMRTTLICHDMWHALGQPCTARGVPIFNIS